MGAITFFDLNKYITEYKTNVFIETGTGFGEGLKFASQYNFTRLFSIEIEQSQVINLQNKFTDDSRIAIFDGNSYEKLRMIFDNYDIDDNILFWLDAHYPGADLFVRPYRSEFTENIKLPLEKELETIYDGRKNCKDVILIDDLRIYEENSFAAGNLKDLGLKDIGKFNNLQIVYDLFDKSHIIRKDFSDTGYLILEPKP